LIDALYVTAVEHEPLPVAHGPPEKRISYEEAELLAAVGELRPGFCERGYRTVKLARYSGIVSLGGRVLEILPKVDERLPPEACRGILLRLLRKADAIPLFRHAPAGQHLTNAPLLEVFIASFFEAVTQIVRGGLLHRYLEAEEDLRVLRGAIVTTRQFAVNSNRPDRVACRFDELTADNHWNRLLKLGLHLVRPWVRSVELYRRWTELWALFDEVDHRQAEQRMLGRLSYDRHAARYRPAVEWVRWIVGLLSPSLRAGADSAPALLFDTNALFQSAMGAALRAGVSHGVDVSLEETDRSLALVTGSGGRQAYRLRPDFVARRGAVVAAVGDAKWKRVPVGRGGYLFPGEADFYQMHAYAAAYDCANVTLIYPWYAELARARETSFEIRPEGGETATVTVMCVDVGSDAFTLRRGGAAPEFGALMRPRTSSNS
jgi:5-methylcytosine-specific restriction enzyme subunit McrC